MRLYLTLLKAQINQRYGFSAIKAELRLNPKKAIGKIGVFIAALVSIGTLLGMYAWMLSKLMPGFLQAGFQDILLGVVLLLSMVLVFFMGFFYLLGFLFFAKDTEFLFSLPISQRTIFASKFTQVLTGEIGMSIALLLPAFVIFGLQTDATLSYWFRAIPTVLFAPFIPLALSGILALLLMRFNALWRRRDLLTIIGSVVLFVAIFTGQMVLTSYFGDDIAPDEIMTLVLNQSGLLSMVASVFPPSGWAAEGLLYGGSKLFLFCSVSILSLVCLLFLSNFIYQSGAIAQTESIRKNRDVRISSGTMKARSSILSIFKKEWMLMLRSPTYAMNGLFIIILGPIMTVIMALTETSSAGDLSFLFEMLEGAIDWRYAILFISAFFMLFTSMNTSVSTSISREGKQFGLMRMFPVAAHKQVFAKFLMGYSVGALTILTISAAIFIILPLPPITILASIAVGLVASIAPTALSMIPDLIKPKLDWNTETEAIKQNMNSMIAMGLGIAYIAIIGFLSYLLISSGQDVGLVLCIDIILCVLADILSLLLLAKMARRSLYRIEG